MSNTQDYVLCPCCGSKVPKGSFCPECGSPLEKVDKSDNGCKMTVPDQNTAPQIGLPDGVLNSFGPAIINGTKLIDLSGIPAGMYFIRITTKKTSIVEELLKL